MVLKKLITLFIIVALIGLAAGVSACGSDGTTDKTTEAVTGTITTPAGKLTIESIEIKPHENATDVQWVLVHMVPEDGTEASATAIYDTMEREALLVRTEDGEEKVATAISQSNTDVQVSFIVAKTATEYTMVWPGNEEIRIDRMVEE
jgi:hypothetical protein